MNDLKTLAPRQAAALSFIRRYIAEHEFSPSLEDIRAQLGVSSRNAVAELIDKLERKGLIEREPGSRRGLRVIGGPGRHTLPLIGRIAAGSPVLAAENIDEHVVADPAAFRPRAHFLRRIKGWSMKDAGIFDCDLVGIHITPDVSGRQIAAVRIEDRQTGEPTLTLKRIRKDGRRLILLSENEDQDTYAPIVVDPRTQPFAIEGLYVGLIRPSGSVPR